MKADLLKNLEQVSETVDGIGRMLSRPIVGGSFARGAYVLASLPIVRHGLNHVMFFVRDAVSGAIVSYGDSRADALEMARKVLATFGELEIEQYIARVRARREKELAQERLRMDAAEEEVAEMRRQRAANVRSIPKRRQRIFEESAGKCHYCETVLTLDGKWHIEHKMPRALGGDSQPGNLVASCVPCNMKKRDTTDLEFKARIAKEKAA